jgi:hypothetical protein
MWPPPRFAGSGHYSWLRSAHRDSAHTAVVERARRFVSVQVQLDGLRTYNHARALQCGTRAPLSISRRGRGCIARDTGRSR